MTTNRQPQEQAYPGSPNFTSTLNLCGDRWLRWYIFTRVGPSDRFCWGLAAAQIARQWLSDHKKRNKNSW